MGTLNTLEARGREKAPSEEKRSTLERQRFVWELFRNKAMTQQLYSHHPYNDSMFMSSIYGSSGGLPYGSGAASDLLHPMTTAHQHQQQQQVFSNSQYPQSQLHHLGLADTGGWTFPPSSALDVQLGLKRPIQEEDSLAASFLSKRAKVDNLVPQRIEPVASISLYPQRPGEKFCTFYMTTSLCKFGASCKFDHPTWVPAGGIPNWKENTVPTAEIPAESGVYPERPGEPDCAFYMKTGLCKYGGNCRFNHPKERPPVNPSEDHPIEGKTEQTKSAGLGADFLNLPAVTEKYDRTAPLNSKGLPLRPGQTDCAFYLKTGNCKYGDSCRFNHPENVAVADVKPAVFAMPQAQLPYSSFLTSIGVANEFGLVGGNYTLPLPGHPYPIRPGEPECTFYMKHGECKFGPNCKFNHPLNRFDPIYTKPVKLTAGGLPRREGEPPCPFYLKTGGCRFQENCKFDHPPPGEFAAKASLQPVKTDESP